MLFALRCKIVLLMVVQVLFTLNAAPPVDILPLVLGLVQVIVIETIESRVHVVLLEQEAQIVHGHFESRHFGSV